MNEIFQNWAEWFPEFSSGFLVSVEVTVISLLVGIPGGLLAALGLSAKTRTLRGISVLFVELGRGAPLLILLQLIYYGLPAMKVMLTSFSASTVAFAWCTAAYTSEYIRAGINSVHAGQQEATHVLGLSRLDSLLIVILPQALKVALPSLLGFGVVMLQSTSLCFTIALPELATKASEVGSVTFKYMSALSLAALIYIAICAPASLLVGKLEQMLSRHEK
ncbi:amino acid ABC transporter permease [Pseudomonas sp. H11T01]|uniref:amino acid ABC transporter permease n=1 Tax=Pseudomonas sp. H11T01 TaxID=3402749 RepID=UPI003AC79501